MSDLLANIPYESDPDISCGESFWKLSDIRKSFVECVEIIKDSAWLAVNNDDNCISYILFDFMMSDGNGINIKVKTVFFGHGYGGSLREMRHTYFGNDFREVDGYLYYPPCKAIAAAFDYLGKYFDLA